jgi:hypothetical protein
VCCEEVLVVNEMLVMLDVWLRATRLWFIYAKCLSCCMEGRGVHIGPWPIACVSKPRMKGRPLVGTH